MECHCFPVFFHVAQVAKYKSCCRNRTFFTQKIVEFFVQPNPEGTGSKERVLQKNILNLGDYLEDHPTTCKWLITMVIVSPLRIGLWDPFQKAELHGL